MIVTMGACETWSSKINLKNIKYIFFKYKMPVNLLRKSSRRRGRPRKSSRRRRKSSRRRGRPRKSSRRRRKSSRRRGRPRKSSRRRGRPRKSSRRRRKSSRRRLKFEEAGADRKGSGLDASKAAAAAPTKKKKTKSHTAKKADRAPCPTEIQAVIDAFASNAPPFDRRDFDEGQVLDKIQYFLFSGGAVPYVIVREEKGKVIQLIGEVGFIFQRAASASRRGRLSVKITIMSYHQIFRVKWENGRVKYAPLCSIGSIKSALDDPSISEGLKKVRLFYVARYTKEEVKKKLKPFCRQEKTAQVCKELMAETAQVCDKFMTEVDNI